MARRLGSILISRGVSRGSSGMFATGYLSSVMAFICSIGLLSQAVSTVKDKTKTAVGNVGR
ncbi:hypothetical protein [uncultured Psychrobacter sp.]|uniref:hypothetical protein n=1 Tax=uncultured Psychrobacter sp. TaxID=259303 RepID=UPI0034586242